MEKSKGTVPSSSDPIKPIKRRVGTIIAMMQHWVSNHNLSRGSYFTAKAFHAHTHPRLRSYHTHTLMHTHMQPLILYAMTCWLCTCMYKCVVVGLPISLWLPTLTHPSTLWFCTLIAHYTPTEVENTDRSPLLEYYVHVHMHYSHGNSLKAYYSTVPVVSGNAQLQLITTARVHYIAICILYIS